MKSKDDSPEGVDRRIREVLAILKDADAKRAPGFDPVPRLLEHLGSFRQGRFLLGKVAERLEDVFEPSRVAAIAQESVFVQRARTRAAPGLPASPPPRRTPVFWRAPEQRIDQGSNLGFVKITETDDSMDISPAYRARPFH